MKQLKHWQDAVNVLLGVWLVLSPWALAFQGDALVTSNVVLVGLALVATALGAILVPRAWEEWTEAFIGLWLMASPWVLGFYGLRQAMFGAMITGLVVIVLAMWTLLTDKDFRNWLSDEPAAH